MAPRSSLLLNGMPASPGIVVGPAHLLRWQVPEVPTRLIPDEAIPAELDRLTAALDKAEERLQYVRERAERTAGAAESAIFDVQISVLQDAELQRRVQQMIGQGFTAERAFDTVMVEWREHFARSSNAMMRERVGDLTDVHIRVLSVLLGLPDYDPVDLPKGSNAILITHDLTPSLTLQLDRDCIAAIATDATPSFVRSRPKRPSWISHRPSRWDIRCRSSWPADWPACSPVI